MKNLLIIIVLTLLLCGFGITGLVKAYITEDWILAGIVSGIFLPLLIIMLHSVQIEWKRYKYWKKNGI
jgi:hypothetical protein